MIKLKYEEFLGFNFSHAMQSLTSMKFAPKVSYHVMKIADQLQKAQKTAHEEWRALVNTYAKKDEAGKIVPREESQPDSFIVEDKDLAAFNAAHEKFKATEVVIDKNPLEFSDLGSNTISPGEMSVLSPLFTEESSAETAPNVLSLHPSA